jgi:acyl-CoA thioester hydrolase
MTSTHAVRVYFEDTDFTGRVYHGAFVRFLERGRTELLRQGGIDHAALEAREPPVYFTVRTMRLAFKGPAVIDDVLSVETRPVDRGRAILAVEQRILRGGRPIVTADVELCLIDPQGRPVRPPADVSAALVPRRGPGGDG